MTKAIKDVKEFLALTVYRPTDVESFLDPACRSWSRFDRELGYVPNDVVMRDGVDNSWSVYTYEPAGNRRTIHHADKPCRINTYGNSFTQCQQVSDGETWQECLSARFEEPVRNFGVGGYGVYQACLRMRRIEATPCGTEYVVLNLFDDDHVRNLDAARWIRSFADKQQAGKAPRMLHGIPWAHLRFDLKEARFVECPSLCPTPDTLRKLCDSNRFHETFKDDQIVRLFVLMRGGQAERKDLEELAEAFGLKLDLRNPARCRSDAATLHLEYGLPSTEYLLGTLQDWAGRENKRFLLLLSYSKGSVRRALEGLDRRDGRLLDCLRRRNLPFVDTLSKHREHYQLYRLTPGEYVDRLFVPSTEAAVCDHHNPLANHLFSLFIQKELVTWLDPKPPAYR